MTGNTTRRSIASEIPQAIAAKTATQRLSEPTRRRARAGLGAIGAVLAASALAAGTSAAATPPSVSETFASTGVEQSFTVPAGVTEIRVRAIGAAGEAGRVESPFSAAAPGGYGADMAGDLPVTPGEVLYVEVANKGWGGGGIGGFEGGGEGGGASDVRTVSGSSGETLESRLLVAGGGGGGGATFEEGSGGRGGDAGTPGANGFTGERFGPDGTQNSAGGGAGTLTGGGSGGARCQETGPWTGAEGVLGSGGVGGEGFASPESGGGGGGGGYRGAGGGEGSCPFDEEFGGAGGGGGGGSSYVEEDATSASFGLASPATAPSVTIGYATPATATPGVSTVSFPGTQPLDTVSAPQTIKLANEGGNPLEIGAETFADSEPALSTDDPEAFLIGSSSCMGEIAFEGSCEVTVRFDPQSTGTSTATLQIAGNMGAGPTAIDLSGTGGTLPQGSQGAAGASGSLGTDGQKGATGPQGLRGQVGPQGARGPQGLTAEYVCHPRQGHGKYKNACFVRLVSASASKAAVKATLERKGVVYASGASGGGQLVLPARRAVPAGRYTLVLTGRHGTSSETVTIG